MDVALNYDELDRLHGALTAIVTEFDDAGARRDALENAVGAPYGYGDLQNVASDFENRWEIRRKTLRDNCNTLAEHVKGVTDGFKKYDEQAASGGNQP